VVNQAGETMQDIVSSVNRVATLMAEISAASQEQSQGIDQVNQTVTSLDDMTQQNAALVGAGCGCCKKPGGAGADAGGGGACIPAGWFKKNVDWQVASPFPDAGLGRATSR
jgi:hypothetical protein